MAVIDTTPARVDLKNAVRGDTWRVQIFFPIDPNAATPVGIDLTGSEWDAHIKLADGDGLVDPDLDKEIFASFDVDTSNQDNGYINLHLDEQYTRNAQPGSTYWYDIQQKRLGDVATPIRGRITILADVTIQEED